MKFPRQNRFNRFGLKPNSSRKYDLRFEFEKLECRNLLAGDLVYVDTSNAELGIINPVIVAGDPNGTPPITSDGLIDPNDLTSPFAGTVAINPSGSNVCSGTLVAPQVVITAGHCVDFNDDGIADIDLLATEVHFNHQEMEIVYSGVAAAIAHPDYTGFANPTVNDDIAVILLSEAAPPEVPIYPLVTDAYELATEVFMVGYGTTGDAINGYVNGTANHDIKRAGQQLAGGFDVDDEGNGLNEIFLWDFDGPDASTDSLGDGVSYGNDREVTVGGGDSGGPSFLWNDANSDTVMEASELSLFGVNTFTLGIPVAAPFFGSQGGGMAVASYIEFLSQFISFGEVGVTLDDVEIESGDFVDFGLTRKGESVKRTFTVSNSDTANLTLQEPILVPDGFTLTDSFGQLELAPGESTTFEVRFNADKIGTKSGELVFANSDSDENPFILVLSGTATTAIGEAGTVSATNSWITVTLDNNYHEPVVVAGPATFNEADPATVRVRNVTSNSFQIRVQEWTYLDGPHAIENLSYVVMERGLHRLPNGMAIAAGHTDGVSTEFKDVNFEYGFDTTPVVLASSVTVNGGAPIVTRLDNVTTDSFRVMVQEEELADQLHKPERIAYIAFEPGVGEIGGAKFMAAITGPSVDENEATLVFEGSDFVAPPVLLANMQHFVGSNTAGLRVTELTNTDFTLFVEEEQSKDIEVGHGNEPIGFFAIQEGDILGRTVIGETGTIDNLDRDWQTIELAQDYLDPVIILAASTMNEADPMTLRVRNVTNNSFQAHIEEWNYLDLNHAPEIVSFVVFESGIHRLRDGTMIEARNSIVETPWTQIDFKMDMGSETPLVISQVASENGPATVTTRHRSTTTQGLEIRLQEEEASPDAHLPETVSWVAIHETTGESAGIQYQAMLLDSVSHHSTFAGFSVPFTTTPVVISSMQTSIGLNTANVRHESVTTDSIELHVAEERSFDNEVGHIAEQVAVFALTKGIIDGFILDIGDADGGGAGGGFGAPRSGISSNDSQANSGNVGYGETIDYFQSSLADQQNQLQEQDSAFAAMNQQPLVHVDIDPSSAVAISGMVSLGDNPTTAFDVRSYDLVAEQADPSSFESETDSFDWL